MKAGVLVKSLADSMPHKIVDPNAETVDELVEATGQTRNWVLRHAREQWKAGAWEQVYKKSGRQLVPAYRAKRK